MPDLVTTVNGVSMTSLELVDFINSQRGEGESELLHKNYLAKVPEVLGERSAEFLADLPDAYGRPRKGYRFPKREACLMAMSYSYDLQAKVFDRMTAMEQQAKAFDPTSLTRMDLIKIAMEAETERLVLADKVQAQQATIALQAPKVEALERIAQADGSMCITNAAKALQQQPKAFFRWLQEHRWIYRRTGGSGWLAYQPRIQQGLLDHKVTTVERSDGTSKMVEQVLVTPKGLTKLAQVVGGVA